MIEYRTYTNEELIREFHDSNDVVIQLFCQRLYELGEVKEELDRYVFGLESNNEHLTNMVGSLEEEKANAWRVE